MPEALERELKKRAKKKGLNKEHMAVYVYGTMRKTGWKPSGEGKPDHKMKSMAMRMRASRHGA